MSPSQKLACKKAMILELNLLTPYLKQAITNICFLGDHDVVFLFRDYCKNLDLSAQYANSIDTYRLTRLIVAKV